MKIGIFIFKDVEILDFTGPYEVFGSARKTSKILSNKNINEIYKKPSPFKVFTVSSKKKVVTSGGMRVICDFTFLDAPNFDILLIPGGKGTRKLLTNKSTLSWLKKQKKSKLIMSVCTGSLLLGAAGLLKNQKATTHWSALQLLKKISPSTSIVRKRYVIDKVFSSSGVASGIDLSLKVVEIFYGKTVAKNTAKYMEYNLLKK